MPGGSWSSSFKCRIISGQQRTGQSARRIVINNQNPFKIVHAIWPGPKEEAYEEEKEELWEWQKDELPDGDTINASSSVWVSGRWKGGWMFGAGPLARPLSARHLSANVPCPGMSCVFENVERVCVDWTELN